MSTTPPTAPAPEGTAAHYLQTLPLWDGIPRIGRVFRKPSNARKFAAFLQRAVARALVPGCHTGSSPVLVLYGPQGTGKSRFLRALAGEKCYQDIFDPEMLPPATPDAWLAEWSDPAGPLDHARLKAALTATHDTYRSLYAQRIERHPRAFVVVATTNDLAPFRALHSPARHFEVIRSSRGFPVDYVTEHRDPLWAEALAAYRASFEAEALPVLAALEAEKAAPEWVPATPAQNAALDRRLATAEADTTGTAATLAEHAATLEAIE